MKVALISDIHSNLEALEAVIEDSRGNGVDHFVCLGDIVGYGPDPEKCIRMVRSLEPRFCVMGNHDLCCTGVMMDMNDVAMGAMMWNRSRISDDSMDWLKGLPMTQGRGDCVFVHSTLWRPEAFNYLMFEGRYFHFVSQIHNKKKVSFVGHTHRPEMSTWNGEEGWAESVTSFLIDGIAEIDPNKYTAVNVGSVGQPRDEQWKATYVICQMNNWKPEKIELRRVEYDVDKTVDKILKCDIPDYCGSRLIHHR